MPGVTILYRYDYPATVLDYLKRLNWGFIICAFVLGLLIPVVIGLMKKKSARRKISVNGINFGIGNISFELSVNSDIQQIAYQLWVELSTRKIAIPFDEENDIITEVYDSWYSAFTAIRELLKSVPGKSLSESSELIELTMRVLNEGLRPHLTRWQAKFRKWYENSAKDDDKTAPQELQKNYPEYFELIADLKTTNQHMIDFADKMREIALGK